MAPPRSRIGAITAEERAAVRARSPIGAKYDTRSIASPRTRSSPRRLQPRRKKACLAVAAQAAKAGRSRGGRKQSERFSLGHETAAGHGRDDGEAGSANCGQSDRAPDSARRPRRNSWRETVKQILVYGDSLSWGIIPNTRQRLPFAKRWPGVLEADLLRLGQPVRIIEDCLNGRRTVWEDPFKPGRNGLVGLEQRIEVNSPLALVILMLGTNDFQATHNNAAWQSAQGIASLVHAIRRAPIEPGMPTPSIMIVSPPLPGVPTGSMEQKFAGARRAVRGAE